MKYVTRFLSYIQTFAGDLRRSFFDLSIVVGVVLIFQLGVLQSIPEAWPQMLGGLIVVAIGLALFLRGLELGIFPLGEALASYFAKSSSRFWLIVFAFVMGFATTIAEPALIAVADKAAILSDGAFSSLEIRIVVALAVGIAIVVGVVRLLLNHPIHYYIIAGYATVLITSFFAPPEIIGIAFDSGGITTSTVTVPLVAALGIGLATYLKNRNPIVDGFGLIAFASLTPMIFVQLYGILVYTTPFFGGDIGSIVAVAESTETAVVTSSVVLGTVVTGLASMFINILPILLLVGFFFFFVIRKPIPKPKETVFGFILVLVGLYAFVFGLEQGLFPIGESIASSLVSESALWVVLLFAFLIGFATTIAEPALTAIAKKAEEVSGGSVKQLWLRVFVALGAGFGIFIGAVRIVQGDPILWFLAGGYLLVIFLTFIAPRSMIPVAYDSGGVTTSTITVPIVAAIGIGLASTIPGRDPLVDGFGMIALTVLFPVISVLLYSIAESANIKRHEKKIVGLEKKTSERISEHLKIHDHQDISEHVPLHMTGFKKKIITITGDDGSGVSTVSKKVADELRYRHFSSGKLFREIAKKHGMDIEKLSSIAENDTAIDHELDALIQELSEKQTKLVIDSRLAYHWVHGSFKVYLKVSPEEGARRIYNNVRAGDRVAEDEPTVESALKTNEKVRKSRKNRYQTLYGVDITNLKPFHLVIETDDKEIEEIVELIVEKYQSWSDKK